MKLVIDIGNTSTKIAIFNNDDIIDFHTIENVSTEYISKILDSHPEINSSIISNVSNYDSSILSLLRKVGTTIELTHDTPLPFSNNYSTPSTLGKDRLAIASAGATLYSEQNVLLIDAGTCVTYDFVDKNGSYHGGAISPGLKMRLVALNTFTDGLPLVDLPKDNYHIDLIGNSTTSSILSGVILGLLSEVESFINQYESRFQELKIIISGGDYKYFEKLAKSNIFASPNIVIHGLKKILDFNEEN